LLQLHYPLTQPHQSRNVPSWAYLQIHVRQICAMAGQHLNRILWVYKILEAFFPHWVEGDDFAAALYRLLQRMKKARTIGPGILAKIKDRIAMLKILKLAGADR
jgi:hypothetical protein